MRDWLSKIFPSKAAAAPEDPAFWKSYVQSINSQPAAATPLTEAEFVVFDTETTGFDTKEDRVLSIGAVKVRGQQVLVQESFECVVRQEVLTGNKSAEVHGLLRKQLEQGVPEQEALQAFLAYIGDSILVGHHLRYDTSMINGMIRRSGINGKLLNSGIDTAQLARRLERGQHHTPDSYKRSEYSLDALITKYNLPTEARHTAPGDAFITAILLLKLLAKAKKRGIETVGELVR
ncbi:3'-5' exonuclease [Pontibacter anaerobius]|uniref:3'-5' exonuclease n=1 Tax=Pontibacter anaerobius TaxID=2993940 RepID=A0ABT3RA61_9BACT|nr:3'-5' exonuclease [Pontibacter anaerobius]MCX2738746.1 3'-5' exonuclease [Pontibacter anaerobius]